MAEIVQLILQDSWLLRLRTKTKLDCCCCLDVANLHCQGF